MVFKGEVYVNTSDDCGGFLIADAGLDGQPRAN